MHRVLRLEALLVAAACLTACGFGSSTTSTADGPLVKSLTAADGGEYTLGVLERGTEIYTDRQYVVTSVPSELKGQTFIRTPNNHKKVRADRALSFELNKKAEVYVAYDRRGSTLPDWLKGWQRVDGELVTSDLSRTLYKKAFDAGAKVALGGNWHGAANGAESNYNVIVRPL